MDRIAEEIISTYIGLFLNPVYLAAAAASIAALMTGLGAKIVEFGQGVIHASGQSQTATAGTSPRPPLLMTFDTQIGERR